MLCPIRIKSKGGFTLIEVLISLGLLLLVMSAVLSLYYAGIQALGIARARITAISVANEQLELVHNLPYSQVGTTTGWPSGVLPTTKTTDRNGLSFTSTTLIKFIDDPFDGDALGTIPNKPVDTQPSDYKLVEVRVCWSSYPCHKPVSVSSTIVQKNIEGADGTGSLYIRALDAGGLPVGQATVAVTNSTTLPAINIVSSTDNDGNLLLSSLPPAQDSYHIVVSKLGYNSDFTVTPGPQNPNPTRPDTSVVDAFVTPLSFFIDKVANLSVLTVDSSCNPVPNVHFTFRGELLDGTSPDVYRTDLNSGTDALGQVNLMDLRWDFYTQTIDPADGYDVAGTTISQPFNVLPDSNQTLYVHLAPDAADTLLITVRESGTLVPLSDATVRLENFSGFDETKSTGKGTAGQRDWSGGAGQIDYTDDTKFFSQDGNIDIANPNSLKLVRSSFNNALTETFDTDIAEDFTTTTADWNIVLGLGRLSSTLGPYDSTGTIQTLRLNQEAGMVTAATLSVNENLNGQSIVYELSADGGNTYENVTPGSMHIFSVSGSDLRLRALLTTTDVLVSPELLDFTVDYVYDNYRADGSLISSTMNLGANTAFDSLQWLPLAQPPATGPASVKYQLATNNDQTTWQFVGPDGTASTYYSIPGDTIWSGHTGDQYIRYKVFLSTTDVTSTPEITNISIVHSAGCIPPGQTFYSPLTPGTYQYTINRPGYAELIDSIDVNGDTSFIAELTPP